MATTTSGALQTLSNDLATAVEKAGSFVMAVNGRERTPSSGIHWRKGIVVTTDHTLKQDEGITVTLTGGQSLDATLVGRDPSTDLAVLRVNELDTPASEFLDGSSIKAGHIVLAIGRGVTASLGIMSAVSGAWRTWRGGAVDHYLRPDVSIYTGFSGGALIDAQARVLGVNTSGLSRGSGLTVPKATVDRVVDELTSRGRILRGYLGIGMQPVRIPGAHGGGGLIVLSVEKDGPADRAGILLGDILLSFDGNPLKDTDDLQSVLGGDRIGKTAPVQVLRGGAVTSLPVTVGERP